MTDSALGSSLLSGLDSEDVSENKDFIERQNCHIYCFRIRCLTVVEAVEIFNLCAQNEIDANLLSTSPPSNPQPSEVYVFDVERMQYPAQFKSDGNVWIHNGRRQIPSANPCVYKVSYRASDMSRHVYTLINEFPVRFVIVHYLSVSDRNMRTPVAVVRAHMKRARMISKGIIVDESQKKKPNIYNPISETVVQQEAPVSVHLVNLTLEGEFSASTRLRNMSAIDTYGEDINCKTALRKYRVKVTFKGYTDSSEGTVYDHNSLEQLIETQIIGQLHNRNIDYDIPYFASVPTTLENIAVFIWMQLFPVMSQPSLLHKVKVFENNSSATYCGQSSVQPTSHVNTHNTFQLSSLGLDPVVSYIVDNLNELPSDILDNQDNIKILPFHNNPTNSTKYIVFHC